MKEIVMVSINPSQNPLLKEFTPNSGAAKAPTEQKSPFDVAQKDGSTVRTTSGSGCGNATGGPCMFDDGDS
jgi:hypothetical protein